MARKTPNRSDLNVSFSRKSLCQSESDGRTSASDTNSNSIYQREGGEEREYCVSVFDLRTGEKKHREAGGAGDVELNKMFNGISYRLDMPPSFNQNSGDGGDSVLQPDCNDELYRHFRKPSSFEVKTSLATPRRLPPISHPGLTLSRYLSPESDQANNADEHLEVIDSEMKKLFQNVNENKAYQTSSKVNFTESHDTLEQQKQKTYGRKNTSRRKSTQSIDVWNMDLHNHRRKSRSSSVKTGGDRKPGGPQYAPTYRMEPLPGRRFRQDIVARLVRRVCDKVLGSYTYSSTTASDTILTLCDFALRVIKHDLHFPRYKYVIHASLIQRGNQGIIIADRALKDRDTDHVAIVKHVVPSYVCVITVHGIYTE